MDDDDHALAVAVPLPHVARFELLLEHEQTLAVVQHRVLLGGDELAGDWTRGRVALKATST